MYGQAFQQLRAHSARFLPNAFQCGAAADSASARYTHVRRALLLATAHWCGIWNRSAYAALTRATSRPGQDALARDTYGNADAIITNPPYTRELMHALIEHLQRIAPTWLLLEADWAYTKQAAPFMPSCSDVVAIGRLRWIEGTTMSSYENFAWYRFDARHRAGPIFHAHGAVPGSSRVSLCGQCGKPYRPRRSDSRFCSDSCRQRAHRSRITVTSRDGARPGDH